LATIEKGGGRRKKGNESWEEEGEGRKTEGEYYQRGDIN
jgi:hypothetical protein